MRVYDISGMRHVSKLGKYWKYIYIYIYIYISYMKLTRFV